MSTGVQRRELLNALADRSRRGDRQAFERLVVETSSQVYSLALRLVGNEQDARDIVQESFLRAYRSIDRFRGDAAVTTWLHRITANCASTHLSKKRIATASISADVAIVERRSEYLPEEVADAADDRQRLIAALDGLSLDRRAVVVLHDVYDLSHEVIGFELGISRTASKVRLHRARRLLRDALFEASETGQREIPPTRPLSSVHGRSRHSPTSRVFDAVDQPAETVKLHAVEFHDLGQGHVATR